MSPLSADSATKLHRYALGHLLRVVTRDVLPGHVRRADTSMRALLQA
jgi:hypothetical protein